MTLQYAILYVRRDDRREKEKDKERGNSEPSFAFGNLEEDIPQKMNLYGAMLDVREIEIGREKGNSELFPRLDIEDSVQI